MADQGSTEQLLELLIQLKKTTPKAARDILNSQPAIAYALISLMVSVGAINIEVFQKTLSQFHEAAARGQVQAGVAPVAVPATSTPPISILPAYLQAQHRTDTPPIVASTLPATQPYSSYPSQAGYPSQGYVQPSTSSSAYPYGAQQQQAYPGYPSAGPSQGYAALPPPVAAVVAVAPAAPVARPPSAPAVRPELLAAFPDEQKALIMHVISMTQEQLNKLPPEQRNTYMQIRATLGIS